MAQNIGRRACRRVDNSPLTSSRFISNPTKRKKIAIRPSFIQSAVVYRKCIEAVSNPSGVFSIFSNAPPSGELEIVKEISTHTNRIIPPLVGESVNFLRIFSISGPVKDDKFQR